MLQLGRGHPHAEPIAVSPPRISPQLSWWLDRLRGEESVADPQRGDSGAGMEASVERGTPATVELTAGHRDAGGSSAEPGRSTEPGAPSGLGETSPEPRLGALQEDCFGEVVLAKLPEPQPLPSYETVEEVKMKPEILLRMCRDILVAPCIDLFASAKHHQFPRYFSADREDDAALGYNAFNYVWSGDVCLYANPPWSLITAVLEKVCRDKSRLLLVTPNWLKAQWFALLTKLAVRQKEWTGKLYLSEQGKLRPVPRWTTLFTYVVGRDANV